MTNNNLIDSTEVAKILNISRPTLAKYIKLGFIKPTQASVTGRHLYDYDYIISIKESLDNDKKENDKLVSVSEASKLLGVCPATIAEYERKGYLTVAKRPTANRRLYSRESVDAMLIKGKGVLLTTKELAKEFKCSPALIAFMDAEGLIVSQNKTHSNIKLYSRETYNKLKELLED